MKTISLLQSIVDSAHKDFGRSPEFPIRATSVFLSYQYLERLCRIDGHQVSHNRIGSFDGPSGHILDKWRFQWDSGSCDFYVDCYADFDSSCAPLGWKLSPRSKDDPWISSNQIPTSPATWESSDEGLSWDMETFVAVLQKNAPTMVEKVCKTGIAKLKESREIQRTLPRFIKYPFVLQCFFKPGQSPIGRDSSRPFRAFAIKQLAYSDSGDCWRYVFCEFNSGGEFNYDELTELPNQENAIKMFFGKLDSNPASKPRLIGTMRAAYQVLHPEQSLPTNPVSQNGGFAKSIVSPVMALMKSTRDALLKWWKGREKPYAENEKGPNFQLFPYGSKYTHLNHEVIHKELYSAKTIGNFSSVVEKFETPHDAWNFNSEWAYSYCKASQVMLFALASDINPEVVEQRLASSGLLTQYEKSALIMCLLPYYKVERYANYLAAFYERNKKGLSFTRQEELSIIKMKDEGILSYLTLHLPSLALHPKDFNAMDWYRHTDSRLWYTYEYSSLLSEAVENNDLEFAAFLLAHGANPNQFLMESIMRSDGAKMESSPVLLEIRSAEMFDLFVKHGLDFYPWSGYVLDGMKDEQKGFRSNLLETLWMECETTAAIQKLYATLYKHQYDAPSKLRMGQLIKQYCSNKTCWKGGDEFEKWVKRNGGTIP